MVEERRNIVVGITGASGAPYAQRLLAVLLAAGRHVHLTVSPAATQVFREELGISAELKQLQPLQLLKPESERQADPKLKAVAQLNSVTPTQSSSIFHESQTVPAGKIVYHHYQNYSAGIASGSFLTDGMVICPCSMSTLSSIATGQSSNLLQRAAEVHLKERRKLILVPRETPLSPIAIDNMKRLADVGVIIMPAMPGFYHQPQTIEDLVDFVVGRICDQLAVRHELMKRWGRSKAEG